MPAVSLSTCRCVVLSQNKGGEGCHVASEKKRRRKHSGHTLYIHRLSPLCVAAIVLNLNKGGLLQRVRKEKKKIERAYLIRPRSVPSARCRPSCVTSLKRRGKGLWWLPSRIRGRRKKRKKRAYLLRPQCLRFAAIVSCRKDEGGEVVAAKARRRKQTKEKYGC